MRSLMIFTPHQVFIQTTKLRRMRWAGHMAHMGYRGAHRVLMEKVKGKENTFKTWTKVGG
jgi:hypothetical protein